MEPNPGVEAPVDRPPSTIERADRRGVASTPGRVWEILPLVALALTTLMLAASAFRVVASSISEPRAIGPIEREPVKDPAAPRPAQVDLLAMDLVGDPDLDDPAPAPSVPSHERTSPPPKRSSVVAITQPPGPEAASVPDRSQPPAPAVPKGTMSQSGSVKAAPAPTPTIPPAPVSDARRVLVRDEDGQPIVARILGRDGDRTAVLLPDGQIGWPDGLIYTDKPFLPASKAALRDRLLAREFAGFHAIETEHYLVLYQGSKPFAQASASLLENLYKSLSHALNRRDVPVHEAEFPLVAIIFKSEDDFRRHKPVAPDVQAYYEMLSNRIFLYERSRKDQAAPEVSALRKPQTVAHEGTHQILQNIGVQPRLSSWPLWLVEGLAEYCASPKFAKNGSPTWAGLGQVNVLHMATLRDLEDPLSTMVPGAKAPVVARDPRQPLVEYLVTRSELTPTDYALSWALTYYLAMKRLDNFLDYIREMSKLAPFEERSPEDQLRAFRAAFGTNLGKLDAAVGSYLRKLPQADAVPYYAVMFEQQIPNGIVRRAAMVSQSPSVIRQWIESTTNPRGAEPRWQILPHPTKARALISAEQWMGNG
jgi:hypothetical protein